MTETEERVVRFLAVVPRATARQVARALWPDSPAWSRAAHRHDGRAGGHGATMPMNAGRILSRMLTRGYVTRCDDGLTAPLWCASLTGVDALSSSLTGMVHDLDGGASGRSKD